MDFRVNANESVKVRLTAFGEQILRERHDKLAVSYNFKLVIDDDGYYVTQLWILMSVFGTAMFMGNDLPFDMNIVVSNGEPIGSV